jgi:hypothetical protein
MDLFVGFSDCRRIAQVFNGHAADIPRPARNRDRHRKFLSIRCLSQKIYSRQKANFNNDLNYLSGKS